MRQFLSLSQQSFNGCHHTAKHCSSWSQKHEQHLPGAQLPHQLLPVLWDIGNHSPDFTSPQICDFVQVTCLPSHSLLSQWGDPVSPHKAEVHYPQLFCTTHFPPVMGSLDTGEAQGQKTAIISVPNQHPCRLAPNLAGHIHDLQQ